MPPPIFCPTCGQAVAADQVRCPSDGTPLTPRGSAPPPIATPVAGASGERRGRREPDTHDDGGGKTLVRPRKPGPRLGEGEEGPSSAHNARRDPLIGEQLGEYVVKERIGVGGMGIVYRGEQPVIGKTVAIKVLRPDVGEMQSHMERLLGEARAVNAIHHRGIIDIFSFGQTPDGRQYFVMEFLDGVALDVHVSEKGALPLREALGISDEILDALGAAHDAGVIHRDFKPSNIFLVRKPKGGFYVKLLDFGLAKKGSHPGGAAEQTHNGLIVGTPEFMAPEQIRGDKVSPATDLYAFGVLLFEMLTGQLPFTATSPAGYISRHLEHEPPSPLELRPDLPEALGEVVLSLLAKAPADRPSGEEVRSALRQVARALPRGASKGALPSRRPPPPAAEPGESSEAPAVRPPPRGDLQRFNTSQILPRPKPPSAARLWVVGAVSAIVLGAGVGFLLTASPPEPPVLDTPEGEVSPLSPVPIAADDPKVARPPAQPSSEPTGPQSPLPQPLGAAPEEKAPPEKQEPSRPKGTLTLVTTPESEVSAGGRKLGRTPLFNVPLTAGNHQLKLKGDDGVTHVFPVAIKAGQKTSYRLLLEDLPAKP